MIRLYLANFKINQGEFCYLAYVGFDWQVLDRHLRVDSIFAQGRRINADSLSFRIPATSFPQAIRFLSWAIIKNKLFDSISLMGTLEAESQHNRFIITEECIPIAWWKTKFWWGRGTLWFSGFCIEKQSIKITNLYLDTPFRFRLRLFMGQSIAYYSRFKKNPDRVSLTLKLLDKWKSLSTAPWKYISTWKTQQVE